MALLRAHVLECRLHVWLGVKFIYEVLKLVQVCKFDLCEFLCVLSFPAQPLRCAVKPTQERGCLCEPWKTWIIHFGANFKHDIIKELVLQKEKEMFSVVRHQNPDLFARVMNASCTDEQKVSIRRKVRHLALLSRRHHLTVENLRQLLTHWEKARVWLMQCHLTERRPLLSHHPVKGGSRICVCFCSAIGFHSLRESLRVLQGFYSFIANRFWKITKTWAFLMVKLQC